MIKFFFKDIEIYSLLLEKAYAKVFSGYQNIELGIVHETIQDLTGSLLSGILNFY